MKYKIFRTDTANDQLYSLIQYIAQDGSVETALSYLADLEKGILLLSDAPYMGSVPRYAILKKQGYRVLIVRRHLIFYKVQEDKRQVMIYGIFDARQNYLNLL